MPFWVTLPSVALGKGPRCRVSWSQHSAKLKKWALEKPFSSFAECHDHGTRQRIFFKKNSNFAECRPEGTRQRIFLKKKFKLCRVPARGHSAKIFFKKKFKLCRVSARGHLAKNFFKKIQTLPSADQRALGKESF